MSWFSSKKKQKPKQYTGFAGDCSPQQQKALVQFRKHVQSKKQISNNQFDDIYLLRFLRARKFDIPKTIKMWDQFVDWRVKNNIDNYKNLKFPQLPQLRKMYPHGYHKVDKQFRPIYIERVGFMDVDKIFKVMESDKMLQYYAVLYQTLLTTIFDGCTQAKIQATGQNDKVSQTMTILDLKHVKLGSASKAYDFVKPVSAMAQNNYPQILGNMFIINAPMLFTGIWAIVKMWIDDKTKQKIKILGSSYKKQLLQYIDPQNLPAFLQGGKCQCNGKQCRLEANVGPWNPEGKQMFENNINLDIKPQVSDHKGFHKQQVLVGSPDVLVEVQVKDQEPCVVQNKVEMQQKSQQIKPIQQVKQQDNKKQTKQQVTVKTEQQKTEQITQGTQTEKQTEQNIQSKGPQTVQQGTQTQEKVETVQTKNQATSTKDRKITQQQLKQQAVHEQIKGLQKIQEQDKNIVTQ